MKEIVPGLLRVAVLVNPDNSGNAAILKSVQSAAQQLGVKTLPVNARVPQEIDGAFVKRRAEA